MVCKEILMYEIFSTIVGWTTLLSLPTLAIYGYIKLMDEKYYLKGTLSNDEKENVQCDLF
jgi:hypothetical protein